ncbi:MAG TPA: 3-deoxy-D-manno-octulosonic acid transferase [bacterium]|nr:3-deoxy-D-manno-octulosonic acid transferase [bacterium]HPJ71111.1 3-deoxy-D-manno-octulosonic acid transferase [bacterium]HPQ66570.1 3-deoxy-D-manno-octulosonic acid transferase [bacterium]
MIVVFYNLLGLCGLLLALPVLALKMATTVRFRRGLGERLGRYRIGPLPPPARAPRIWIQAASVGEVNAALPLVAAIRRDLPEAELVVTTQTAAGRDTAREKIGQGALCLLCPLDLWFFVKKFVDRFRPSLLILIETEIWPALIAETSRRGIPICVCNGRVSESAFAWYRRGRFFLRPFLRRIDRFCMRGEEDARRARAMGVPHERIRVTGNLKYDVLDRAAGNGGPAPGLNLRIEPGDRFLVAGSTFSGEEEIVGEAFSGLRKRHPRLRLIVAPRHLERVDEVVKKLRLAGLEPVLYSALGDARPHPPVVVLDRFGILYQAYGLADLVFVGRSLRGGGGQNPIEPASLGRPVVFGSGMKNFKAEAELLVSAGAAAVVERPEDFAEEVEALLNAPERLEAMGRAARLAVESCRGASERNLQAVRELLEG